MVATHGSSKQNSNVIGPPKTYIEHQGHYHLHKYFSFGILIQQP